VSTEVLGDPTDMTTLDAVRRVGCELTFELGPDTVLALQVAPSLTAGRVLDEQLELTVDGRPVPGTEVPAEHGGRTHVLRAGPGTLRVAYAGTIRPVTGPPSAPVATGSPSARDSDGYDRYDGYDAEAIVALRQSRYCPSDALAGFAAAELAHVGRGPDLGRSVASWVFERVAYQLGVSGPLDTAVDTLLANAGACRDMVHLTIALCRALGLPARLVAVYAPGLAPMDFHAVAETRRGPGWEVLDPTRRAPRSSLVRIATGRDAADAAFATTLRGDAELLTAEVNATVDGDLPLDDHEAPATLL
jgi:transglutaminase-like putative cysteine protease